jgi:GDP-L-fucose synthase
VQSNPADSSILMRNPMTEPMSGTTRDPRLYVAGGHGLLAPALRTAARRHGCHVIEAGEATPDSDADAVDRLFARERPDWVIVAGGRSAGIGGNERFPADLMVDNLRADTDVLMSAQRHGARRLLYLAPGCVYPRQCPQPMRPEHLLTGPLEPTSEPYALAKLAGLTLCRALRRQHAAPFVSAIAANPFGPGDDFAADTAHVIPALIARLHSAREANADAVAVWGTGRAVREFIYADDLADACLFVLATYDAPEPINLGTADAVSIGSLAGRIRDVVGYRGRLEFDPSRPDGMPDKRLDSSALRALGWRPSTGLTAGLAATYAWFLETTGRATAAAAGRA